MKGYIDSINNKKRNIKCSFFVYIINIIDYNNIRGDNMDMNKLLGHIELNKDIKI